MDTLEALGVADQGNKGGPSGVTPPEERILWMLFGPKPAQLPVRPERDPD